jgi:hypothetical protein
MCSSLVSGACGGSSSGGSSSNACWAGSGSSAPSAGAGCISPLSTSSTGAADAAAVAARRMSECGLVSVPEAPGECSWSVPAFGDCWSTLGSFSLSEDCSLVVAPTTERSPSSVAPSAGMERSVKLFCELALERPPSERAGDGGSLSGELLLEDASRRGDAGQGASHCMIFVSAQNEKRYRFWTLCDNSILIHAPLLCTAQLRRPRSTAAQTALLFRRHRAI